MYSQNHLDIFSSELQLGVYKDGFMVPDESYKHLFKIGDNPTTLLSSISSKEISQVMKSQIDQLNVFRTSQDEEDFFFQKLKSQISSEEQILQDFSSQEYVARKSNKKCKSIFKNLLQSYKKAIEIMLMQRNIDLPQILRQKKYLSRQDFIILFQIQDLTHVFQEILNDGSLKRSLQLGRTLKQNQAKYMTKLPLLQRVFKTKKFPRIQNTR